MRHARRSRARSSNRSGSARTAVAEEAVAEVPVADESALAETEPVVRPAWEAVEEAEEAAIEQETAAIEAEAATETPVAEEAAAAEEPVAVEEPEVAEPVGRGARVRVAEPEPVAEPSRSRSPSRDLRRAESGRRAVAPSHRGRRAEPSSPTRDVSVDQAEMRRRIEETRARLKAKAFDAMMSGESALLSRDSGEKPVPRGEDGVEVDHETAIDARRVLLARRRLTLDRRVGATGRAAGRRPAPLAFRVTDGQSRLRRSSPESPDVAETAVVLVAALRRRQDQPIDFASAPAVAGVSCRPLAPWRVWASIPAVARKTTPTTVARRRDRAVLEEQEEVPPDVDAEIETRERRRRARRRSCRARGRRAGWTASSRRGRASGHSAAAGATRRSEYGFTKNTITAMTSRLAWATKTVVLGSTRTRRARRRSTAVA